MIQILLMLLVSPASAIEFSQHPAVLQDITCKKIDYNSYFIAQNAESNLKKLNPEVSKPNFAGQYLLLRNEMLMETLWLVVDCKTGKFMRENISGKEIDFKPNSSLIVLKKDQKTTEHYVWSTDAWMKVDSTLVVSTNPAVLPKVITSAEGSFPQYESLYAKYAVKLNDTECKALDYNSYFKAQRSEENIKKVNTALSRPNFGGKYLLVKNEMLFETVMLLADCSTGKFLPLPLSGKGVYKPDSTLVLSKQSGDYPQLMVWQDDQWIQIFDTVQDHPQKISNLLYGKKAKELQAAIANPEKDQIVRFENLVCKDGVCTYDRGKSKALKVETAHAKALSEWVPLLGSVIDSGTCKTERSELQCEMKSH